MLHLQEEEREGLLLLVDFEKAFDSLEWSFIDRTLTYFNFGESVRKWVKIFYTDITSAIAYNGHLSAFFPVSRGVRQGDPLSPYLFILCVELLADGIKTNPNIKGVKIKDTEFLIGQYADDTFFTLDGSESSLHHCLNTLELFTECSGLKVNIDKTKAIWLGSKSNSTETMCSGRKLNWETSETFVVLGITFSTDLHQIPNLNYNKKFEEIKQLLESWSWRHLSIQGKIQVIKSLAVPKIVHLLSSLPSPDNNSFHQMETLFYSFIWSNKRDKIARKTIINTKENGGLKMIDIRTFDKALKISWVKKICDENFQADWKKFHYSVFGSWTDVWFLNKKSIKQLAVSLSNPFWTDVLKSWAEYINDPRNAIDFLKQPLWNNLSITISKKPVCRPNWEAKGIRYINDIVDQAGQFLTHEAINQKFNLNCNFLEVYSIVSAIPKPWKKAIKDNGDRLEHVKSLKIEELLKSKQKTTKVTYNAILQSVASKPIKAQRRWCDELSIPNIKWETYYCIPFNCTVQTKLQSFQYKIFHRILATNKFLMKIGTLDSDKCTFCREEPESIVHLFWHCNTVQYLWDTLSSWVAEKTGIIIFLSQSTVVLGYREKNCMNNSINFIILVFKYYIYKSKLEGCPIVFNSFQKYLQYMYNIEKLTAKIYTNTRFEAQWRNFKNLFI